MSCQAILLHLGLPLGFRGSLKHGTPGVQGMARLLARSSQKIQGTCCMLLLPSKAWTQVDFGFFQHEREPISSRFFGDKHGHDGEKKTSNPFFHETFFFGEIWAKCSEFFLQEFSLDS